METNIRILPAGPGEVRHEMAGTEADIPRLLIGPVEVTFYDFTLDDEAQIQWLRDLSAHALSLAEKIAQLSEGVPA